MSWGILLFFLMYPWRLTVLNLPWEMAVTQDLSLCQGKQAFYRGKRAMCNDDTSYFAFRNCKGRHPDPRKVLASHFPAKLQNSDLKTINSNLNRYQKLADCGQFQTILHSRLFFAACANIYNLNMAP